MIELILAIIGAVIIVGVVGWLLLNAIAIWFFINAQNALMGRPGFFKRTARRFRKR